MQGPRWAVPDPGRSLIVEFIGAFTLTFAGVAAIAVSSGNLVAIGLAHGLAIGLMVAALGHISGGHYNPAITIGMYLAGKIDAIRGVFYIIAQLLGAVVAALLLKYILSDLPLPNGANLGSWVEAGVPKLGHLSNGAAAINNTQGLLLEGVMTFFLFMVVFGTMADPRNVHRAAAGLAIGLTIVMDWYLGGPLTGAVMNPSRSFGPALVANEWTDWWIYWAAPIVGAGVAAIVYHSLLTEEDPEHDRTA